MHAFSPFFFASLLMLFLYFLRSVFQKIPRCFYSKISGTCSRSILQISWPPPMLSKPHSGTPGNWEGVNQEWTFLVSHLKLGRFRVTLRLFRNWHSGLWPFFGVSGLIYFLKLYLTYLTLPELNQFLECISHRNSSILSRPADERASARNINWVQILT